MLKTKKELMLELGKLNLELNDLRSKLSAIIDLYDLIPAETTRDNLRILYAKISGGKPPLSQIKVDGYDIILSSSCTFNEVPERYIKNGRKKEWVFARAFYCVLCLELGLRTENELASDIGRDRTSILHYKKLYKTNVKFRKRYDAFVNSMM